MSKLLQPSLSVHWYPILDLGLHILILSGQAIKKFRRMQTLLGRDAPEPSCFIQAAQMLKDARTFLDFYYDWVTLHGVRFGKGMKTIMVPRYSKGTLITWSEGLLGIVVVEHNTDSHIHVKELFNKEVDKLCHLYLYGFLSLETEEAYHW